jgi:hypothetical protein
MGVGGKATIRREVLVKRDEPLVQVPDSTLGSPDLQC